MWSGAGQQVSSEGRCRHVLAAVVLAPIAVVLSNVPARALCDVGSPCVSAPLNLGTLGGTYSVAYRVSADGSVVVGDATTGTAIRAFRWTSGGGMQDLGTLGGTGSGALGISADGSVVVGSAQTAGGASHAFRWTSGGGMQDLGTLGGTGSGAWGVSADGSVVVGNAYTGTAFRAFRWTSGGGMQDLGTLPGHTYSSANDVSADGSVVVGTSGARAFRWTVSGGMVDLGTVVGSWSTTASRVSSDGSTVVGNVYSSTGMVATRWAEVGGIQTLGNLGSSYSYASAVSADGQVIAGGSAVPGSFWSDYKTHHAFRWTAATGMQDLNTLLANAGVNMSGIVLHYVADISQNGQYLVGSGSFSGQDRAYIVRYYDGIGGVTSPGSVQQSIDDLSQSRFGVLAQQHGLAVSLLGGDKPLEASTYAGGFASGGSVSAGGFLRYSTDFGLSVLGGVSYARESYADADLLNGSMGGLAVQYIYPSGHWLRPYFEGGGWLAPEASVSFSRSYMNGSGTATGVGRTKGDLSYVYARSGLVFSFSGSGQLVLSGEYGREKLATDGYGEALSSENPFEARVSGSTDTSDLAKLRVQVSERLGSRLDGTVWASGVQSFNRQSDIVVSVSGLGMGVPSVSDGARWLEYGARIGYKVTDTVTLDTSLTGVSGDTGLGSRVHGGVALRFQY